MAKISRLEIKNCLGISELEIQAGKINIISGGNERGKTSVLEVIERGLQNTQRRSKFVKEGEQEATLYIEMDDNTIIDRTIKSDGKVNSKITQNGASIPKPETYLKSITGEGFGFNPVDFMSRKDKEQTEILLSLIPMRITEEDLMNWFGEVPPVNLNQHAIDVLSYLAEKYFYDKRTIANGEVRECQSEIKALFEQLPDNYDGNDWKDINIGKLWAEVKEAEQNNNIRSQAQSTVDNLEERMQAINNKFDLQIKEQVELLEFKIDKARKSVEQDKQVIKDDISDLESRIADKEDQIKRLKKEIQDHKNMIILKENDLKNIDETMVAVKVQSLNNEHNVILKNIEEKRQVELEEVKERAEKAQMFLDVNDEIDISPLENKALLAEKMKGYIPLYEQMKRLQSQLIDKQDYASKLDDYVSYCRTKPAELLQTIQLPIKGLGINEEMLITVDGLPISNLSTSRQIKLALDIARVTAGPLKLICVDRFESLDEEQREIFLKEIEYDDFQYFITQVTSGELKVETKEGSVA